MLYSTRIIETNACIEYDLEFPSVLLPKHGVYVHQVFKELSIIEQSVLHPGPYPMLLRQVHVNGHKTDNELQKS